MVLDDDLLPGTPLEDVLPLATDVLELEITPNRPDCLAVYGVAREVHAATGAPSCAPLPRGRAAGGRRDPRLLDRGATTPTCARASPRVLYEDVELRRVAAVAEGAADGGRAAADLQRRRHHQLRDAARRAAAARVRRRPRGRRLAGRAARARRRDDHHARRRRAHARLADARDRGRRGADVDRRDHGRRALRGQRRHDARADGGGELERAEHPAHLVAAGAADRGVRAVREGAVAGARARRPGAGGEADGRAVRGAAGGRDDRRRRARARRRRCSRLREARVEALLGLAIPRDAQARDPRGAGLRGGAGGRRARRDRAALAPQRRHARGRPRRGGRADLGLREAADHAAVAARRERAARAGAAAAAAGRGRAGRRRACRRSWAGASRRRGSCGSSAIPDDDPRSRVVRLANPMSEDQSVLRTLAARPAARQPASATGRAGTRTCGCGSTARSTWRTSAARRGRRGARRRPQPRPSCPASTACRPSAQHLAALLTGRLRPAELARRRARAGRLLRRQGRARRADGARCGCRGRSSRRASRSCTPAAPRGCWPAASRRAGWASSIRRSRRAGTSSRRRASSSTSACSPRTPTLQPDYEDLTSFPAVREDVAVVVPDGVSAAQLVAVVRKAGGALLRRAEVFDVYRGAQVGEGARVARAAARVPRARPHADRRGRRRAAGEDRRRALRAARSAAAWLSVAVLGASGYAGAIAASLIWRHPFFELKHVTARSESGALLDEIHPRTRVPLLLEDYDPDVQGDVDAALVCWPHRRLRAGGGRAARARRAGRRPVGRLPPARPRRSTRTGTARTARPTLFGAAVYGLPELYREQIAGADLVANPGCYPTAALLGAGAAGARGRDQGRGDRREVGRQRAPGASRRQTTHYISADENMTPYKVERHRHTPEIEQELAVLGATLPITFTPHLVPLAQGRAGVGYVDAGDRAGRGRAAPASTTTPTRASRGSRSSSGRPACSRCARPTTAASPSTATTAPAACSCSPRSTTCGRARRRRRCRTST